MARGEEVQSGATHQVSLQVHVDAEAGQAPPQRDGQMNGSAATPGSNGAAKGHRLEIQEQTARYREYINATVKYRRYVLHPNKTSGYSALLPTWDIVAAVALVYTVIISPFEVCKSAPAANDTAEAHSEYSALRP